MHPARWWNLSSMNRIRNMREVHDQHPLIIENARKRFASPAWSRSNGPIRRR
jgi:hypothetical protein